MLNHLRDAPRVEVRFTWGMVPIPETAKGPLCLVTVANVGRRPVFLSHVHLVRPWKRTRAVIPDSISGFRLGEGDPPKVFTVSEANVLDDGGDLAKVRAVVTDSAGKNYCSRLPGETGLRGTILYHVRCRGKNLLGGAAADDGEGG